MDSQSSNRWQEIQLSLHSIVDSSEKLLHRLEGRERSVRLASAFLTGFLVFFVSAVIGYIVTQSVSVVATGRAQSFFFRLNSGLVVPVLGTSALLGLLGGIATYYLFKRRHEARLKEISSLITEMKEPVRPESHGITEDALSLADKITSILPDLVRKRNQDSLLFGVVAFIVAEIVAGSFAVAIIVGVIVWLYFRYETRRVYEREISKLEEQRRVFEQRKNELIEMLSALP